MIGRTAVTAQAGLNEASLSEPAKLAADLRPAFLALAWLFMGVYTLVHLLTCNELQAVAGLCRFWREARDEPSANSTIQQLECWWPTSLLPLRNCSEQAMALDVPLLRQEHA